jgi:hypothetical protein
MPPIIFSFVRLFVFFLLTYPFVDAQSIGTVTTVAGSAGVTGSADGTGSIARFNHPQEAAIDPTGTFALIVRVFPSQSSSPTSTCTSDVTLLYP